MSLITKYLSYMNGISSDFSGYDIWIVGTENTIEKGFRALYSHLDEQEFILTDELEIFDYNYGSDSLYVFLYHALPKLAYLEWKYEQLVDKNKIAENHNKIR